MTKDQYNQLERIYNTFCLVNTNGEDTIIMGQALNAFKIYLQQLVAAGFTLAEPNSATTEIKE